ncbi:CvpA family protein [Clostridia bacterium OttesenSCG-928-F22]|nr:CvpA family protein [Clostridia bacterium OttesenSCG-928-F22]
MNIVDIVILALILIGIVMGAYKGFLYSIINVGIFFLSILIALLFSPIMSRGVMDTELFTTVQEYTDGAQRIHTITMVHTPVDALSEAQIESVVKSANLPSPFGSLLEKNLNDQAFEKDGLITLGNYFDRSLAIVVINIFCFVLMYFIAHTVLTVFLSGTNYVIKFPVLKHFDSLVGGCFGAVHGIFFVFLIFMLVPVIFTLLPYDSIISLVETSAFGNFFYQYNFLLSFIGGA